MSWEADSTATASASAASRPGAATGSTAPIAAIAAISATCSASIQPRRRPRNGSSIQSNTGAHTNLNVYASPIALSVAIRPRSTPADTSHAWSVLPVRYSGNPDEKPSTNSTAIRRDRKTSSQPTRRCYPDARMAAARARIGTAARWLAPSGACACAGALVGGAVDGLGQPGAWAAVVATGFLGLVAVPALLAASAAWRGLYALWQPGALAAALVEDGGGAPRLAGWIGFLYLAALGLAWAMFQGTWQLASWTAFKPLTLGYAVPLLAVGAAIVLVALSRPVARLLALAARAIDRRWRRGDRRHTLLRPRVLLAGAAVLALATAFALWRLVVRPNLGPLDTSFLYAPAAAIAATCAAHGLWHTAGPRARAIAGGAAAGLAAAAIAAAVAAVHA